MSQDPAHALWPVNKDTTRFLLIRHGETDWNRERRFQGFTDIPLNAAGLKQAKALAERFAQLQKQAKKSLFFSACYSSDLSRAQHTASVLCKACAFEPITSTTNLRERDYGDMAGLTGDDMAKQFPDAFAGVSQRDPHQLIPNGETLAQFNSRIISEFQTIEHAHPGQTVLIVAHGGVLDCIFRYVKGLPLEPKRDWLLPNTALNVVDCIPGHGYVIQMWADVYHCEASEWSKNLDEVDGRVA
ncbi:MAG: histidine phosphatase family protein [Limnobacter sp.]|nr:histidine phosphatase family protein [Limnobacter sp.]